MRNCRYLLLLWYTDIIVPIVTVVTVLTLVKIVTVVRTVTLVTVVPVTITGQYESKGKNVVRNFHVSCAVYNVHCTLTSTSDFIWIITNTICHSLSQQPY